MTPRSDEPDIVIGAAARAKKLRFNKVPETEVEFEKEGEIRLDDTALEIETASDSKRENLPDEVEPNKTYRDVEVRWAAAARLRATDRDDRD